MKKIVYVSGSRADFNVMINTLLELNKCFDLTIIVTGMHLSIKWGKTIDEIEKYRFKLRKVDINLEGKNLSSMVKSLGVGIIKITTTIEEIMPDLIFVEGDRGEALAGAIVGAHLNIPVIHHGGGDISGSIDDKIRNALTMFSDYHLTGNLYSYNKLVKMGLDDKKIFNVGEPGLDSLYEQNYTQKDEIIKKFKINPEVNLLILIFHPNTKEFANSKMQIIQILEAIKELKIPTIGLYANADAGGLIINEIYEKYQKELLFLKIYKHLFREDFVGLMSICSAMIGNSSSGLTELPFFKKPFICVGTRQKGRLMAKNVLEVNYNKEEIKKAIAKGLYDKKFRRNLENLENPYGDGKSYLKITEIIREILED